jgi:hypothetical protein
MAPACPITDTIVLPALAGGRTAAALLAVAPGRPWLLGVRRLGLPGVLLGNPGPGPDEGGDRPVNDAKRGHRGQAAPPQDRAGRPARKTQPAG